VGHVPFQAETFNELLFKIVLETPPPLQDQLPGIDPSFVALVNKGMARDPDERYATAAEFQNALRQWLGGAVIPAGRTVNVGTPNVLDKTALPGPGMQTPFNQTPAQGASHKTRTAGATAEGQNAEDALPIRKSPPIALIVGAGAAVLALVGVVVALSGGGESDADEAVLEAADSADAAAKKNDEERSAAILALAEERAKAEEARLRAEQAQAEAVKNKNDLQAQVKAAAAKAEAAEAAAAAAPPAVRPRPSPRPAPANPAPAPAAAPAPRPAPAPAKSGGRIITTDL
jgi:serine/threonine-protein kinase